MGCTDNTITQLHGHHHHSWSCIFYCVAPHLHPAAVASAAAAIDSSLFSTREGRLYDGAFSHHLLRRRLSLPARRHGGGVRSRVSLAPVAFVSGFVEAAERFLDSDMGGGVVEHGFFLMLHPLFGAGSFDPQGPRLQDYLAGNTPMAQEFSTAWDELRHAYRARVGVDAADGPLQHTAGMAGADGSHRLQHRLTTQLEDAEHDALDIAIRALPACELRRAWLDCDEFSSQWVGAWPSDEHAIGVVEFPEVMATYFGLESPLLRQLAGQRIPDGPADYRVCDPYGIQLASAVLPGRTWDDHHDEIARVVYRDVVACGIRGDWSPHALFAGVIPAAAMRRVGGLRLGIIPDMQLRGVPFPDPTHVGRTVGHLFDLKTIRAGTSWYQSARAQEVRAHAVQSRALTVRAAYEAHARELDPRYHGVSADDVRRGRVGPGPILRQLRTFPTVVGIAFGARGEASGSVHRLCDHACC